MTLTKLTLFAAAAWLATNALMKTRRVTMPMSAASASLHDGAEAAPFGRDGDAAPVAGSGEGAPPAFPYSAADVTGAPGVGADSPNEAERLQANGIGAAPANAPRDDPFASTPQQSPYAQAPGLPDFFRGA